MGLFVGGFVCWWVCLLVGLFVDGFVCWWVCLLMGLFVDGFVYWWVCLLVGLFVGGFVCWWVCLLVCLFVCLLACLVGKSCFAMSRVVFPPGHVSNKKHVDMPHAFELFIVVQSLELRDHGLDLMVLCILFSWILLGLGWNQGDVASHLFVPGSRAGRWQPEYLESLLWMSTAAEWVAEASLIRWRRAWMWSELLKGNPSHRP